MKLVVSSSELLKAALIVSKAIPSKTSEPILDNFLFDLKGNTLTITASDMEITLKTEIEVEKTDEEGRIAVPAKQITELLKELPDQPITISTENGTTVECSWASGASTHAYFNADDYPQIKEITGVANTVTIPSETLLEGISSTLYASSDEDSRPIMQSIFFDIKTDLTTLVASDLQKLICYNTDEVKTDKDASFILNKRHAAVIKSILGKEDTTIEVTYDDKVVVMKYGQTSIICCLVVGNYPDYKTIIPKNNSNVLTINRLQLLNTVRRIAVCSPKASNHIKFDLAAGSLEASAQDVGYGIAAHDKISCQYDGDEISIGFKSTHIVEILSNLTCDEVVMKFADKRRSVLVLPSEGEADKEKVFGIVMPVMVR